MKYEKAIKEVEQLTKELFKEKSSEYIANAKKWFLQNPTEFEKGINEHLKTWKKAIANKNGKYIITQTEIKHTEQYCRALPETEQEVYRYANKKDAEKQIKNCWAYAREHNNFYAKEFAYTLKKVLK